MATCKNPSRKSSFFKKGICFLMALILLWMSACAAPAPSATPFTSPDMQMPAPEALDPNGIYTTKEDVALFLHLYGQLPDNFMTKAEARQLGWEGGPLEPYAPGMCIGGDSFGNYEGLLPESSPRNYYECDINTLGGPRGAERIVYSDDGLIYYTKDHYNSFILLYGDGKGEMER